MPDLAPGPSEGQEPLPTPSSSAPPVARRTPIGRVIGHYITYVPALVPAAIVVAIIYELLVASGFSLVPFHAPANFGWGFFGSTWQPHASPPQWGIMVFIVGSFITAVPALFFSMIIGLGIAIASTTYLPRLISRVLDPFVDLLAGIPSVVYGIWGYIIVAPYFGSVLNPWLYTHAHFVPGLGPPPPETIGLGLPVSIFILTLMALPITTLLIRDALRSVPRDLWESGLALGATRWETLRRVAIPHSSRGILSAAFLGFGRAFSETIALAILLGVVTSYPANFYQETATLATVMLQNLDAAYGNSQWLAALSEMALVLLAVSLIVNVVGRRLVSTFVAYDVAGL
jgi:phosphate transport system permease protein